MNLVTTFKHSILKLLKSSLFIVISIYLLIQLQLFNIDISLLDEGFIQYNSFLITQGQIPYKDFFLTSTPGSYYLLALLMKIFGPFVILNRFIAIFFGISSLIVVSKIFKLTRKWQLLYLLSLAAIYIHPTYFGGYNNAIDILLIALLFLIKGLEKKKLRYLVICGLLSSLCFIFKQSFGLLLLPSFLFLIIYLSPKNDRIKFTFSYIASSAFLLLIFLGYFYFNNGLNQMIYYVFLFAGSVKNHQFAFLWHRLLFIPIFIILGKIFLTISLKKKRIFLLLLSLFSIIYLFLVPQRIGRLLDYVKDPVFYIYSIVTLLPIFIIIKTKNKDPKHKIQIIYSITLIVLFLGIASSGYSFGILFGVYTLLIPLSIYFRQRFIKANLYYDLLLASIIIVTTLLISFNPMTNFNQFKDIFVLNKFNQELSIPEAKYIKVDKQTKDELDGVIKYIQLNSLGKDKIFCFPYCPQIYFLANRNSASFFTLFYFETFMAKNQNVVISELKKEKPKLIIIQKKGRMSPNANIEKERLKDLYLYLINNYKITLSTKNFDIYK